MPPSSPASLRNADLSRRLNIAIYVPMALLVAVGLFLYLQVNRLSSAAQWMDHSDKVIGKLYETQKLILDQETGIRGFLVTGERTFLQPFNEAHPHVTLEELYTLVADNPAQQSRVAEVRRLYEAWIIVEDSEILGAKNLEGPRSFATMLKHKQDMDDIRAAINAVLTAENQLRHERTDAVEGANRNTQVVIVSLLIAAGILIAFLSRRQIRSVAEAFGSTLAREREARDAIERQEWMRSGQMRVTTSLHGDLRLSDIGARVLESLIADTGAAVGAFYVAEAGGFKRYASQGVDAPEKFALGEGIVGQAGQDNRLLHLENVPRDFLRIEGASGSRDPVAVVVVPASVEQAVHAVFELGFLGPVEPRALELLERVRETVAISVRSAEYRKDLRRLVDETEAQAASLQAQQEELKVTNEELEEQSEALRHAQKELELQQVELEQTNENLDQHAKLLGRQNDSLKEAQAEIIERAAEVSRSNQYKSEFLANMSHELRTPLNSSLILSKLLADNKSGNLTAEQVKFAETIYAAGNDLLTLINDILDLSKIEAGKMEVDASVQPFPRLVEPVQRMFEPLARQRGFAFEVVIEEAGAVETDVHKVQQILKNLLANAFKFTDTGKVRLHATGTAHEVSVAVTDTGIGIAEGQLEVIFEAFRQADGTTNRKYGGTGLGLSISRDLARLLGGDLTVTSELGKGSTFTLRLPRVYLAPAGTPLDRPVPSLARPSHLPAPRPPAPAPVVALTEPPSSLSPRLLDDDREGLDPAKRLVLVVEDDVPFAQIMVDLAHEQGFQCIVSGTADEGIRLAQKHVPRAILLDMNLPDHSGLSVLDRLKRNAATRHIPVHVMSVADYSQTALAMGAVSYDLKPVKREQIADALAQLETRWSSRVRRILVVEDDTVQRESVEKLLGSPEVETVGAGTVAEALQHLRSSTFDCVVTDLSLPDESGYDLLEHMAEDETYSFPPVIVYTGRSLTREEEQRLRKYSSTIIVKGARSPERLVDEVTLFLHQVESSLTPERQRMLKQVRDREAVFEGRRILVVEDDVRNIFALTSVLEPKGASIEIARNGREALVALEKHVNIDLVLMDIMMPEMDGITCMQEIRKKRQWSKLPIIALTAKAMKDDQERCLRAGANDYISKPLDVEMLLSLLRVWMPK